MNVKMVPIYNLPIPAKPNTLCEEHRMNTPTIFYAHQRLIKRKTPATYIYTYLYIVWLHVVTNYVVSNVAIIAYAQRACVSTDVHTN